MFNRHELLKREYPKNIIPADKHSEKRPKHVEKRLPVLNAYEKVTYLPCDYNKKHRYS